MAHTLVIIDKAITGILGDVVTAADYARTRLMHLAVPGTKIPDYIGQLTFVQFFLLTYTFY